MIDLGFREASFGGVPETIVTREAWPDSRILEVLRRERGIVGLGFGSQSPGQTTQLRNLGLENLIVCQRKSYHKPGGDETNWEKALRYGWKPGVNLFSEIEEAMPRGTMHLYLISDGGQVTTWPTVKNYLKHRDALNFSHGFSYVFKDITGVIPPKYVDLGLVAPKATGSSVERGGMNASYEVPQDYTGRGIERILALGMGIGSGIMLQTTFPNETYSDLFGERFFLLGGVRAIAEVSDERELRRGKNKFEAFINSSEQITQVILPLIGEKGFDEIYARAQAAGQLGTVRQYETAVREAAQPFMEELYNSVKSGNEARKAVAINTRPDYENELKSRLRQIDSEEMWEAGKFIRNTVPDRTYGGTITNWQAVGMIIGTIKAQYQFLIDHGHKTSEAINETVEEMVRSLNPFYSEKGIAYLLGKCSTTAQVGADEWSPKFMEVLRQAVKELRDSYGNDVPLRIGQKLGTKPNMEQVYLDNMKYRPSTRAA